MKNLPVLAIIVGVAVAAVADAAFAQGTPAAPTTPAPASTPAAKPEAKEAPKSLGVDELMKDVDNHRGEIDVEGIVSAAAKGRVSLIDCSKVECGDPGCCTPLTLPVEWSGKAPEVKQRIRLHGKVRETKGKLVFVADKLEVVYLGVDELTKNTDKYRSAVDVEGVVSAVAKGRVSLVQGKDQGKDAEKDGGTKADEPVLSVEWTGKPPEVKQRVRLHGKVRESDGKVGFVADKLHVVPPPNTPTAKPQPEMEKGK